MRELNISFEEVIVKFTEYRNYENFRLFFSEWHFTLFS